VEYHISLLFKFLSNKFWISPRELKADATFELKGARLTRNQQPRSDEHPLSSWSVSWWHTRTPGSGFWALSGCLGIAADLGISNLLSPPPVEFIYYIMQATKKRVFEQEYRCSYIRLL
jgi:hypothetical protein